MTLPDIPVAHTPELKAFQKAVADYAENDLKPHEVTAELNAGVLPRDIVAAHLAKAVALGLPGMDVPVAHGGSGRGYVGQVVAWEQLGRITNAISWCFPEAYGWEFEHCTKEQLDAWVRPKLAGGAHTAYAITESGPGSDAAGTVATADEVEGGYRLNGEKWYVTDANFSDVLIVQARIMRDGEEVEQALFFCDEDADGVKIESTPLFSHTYAAHHPVYSFTDVFVAKDRRLGREGDGMAFTHAWFRRERLMIAARCCGAMARLIEEAQEFANSRIIEGRPLADRDWVQFALADAATNLWAARLMTYKAAEAQDTGADAKKVHGQCAMAKLFASEAANKVVDDVVQIFGGRGYMRENVAERFYRELRVDRIWEGTSEIQRLIIARRLNKYGLAAL